MIILRKLHLIQIITVQQSCMSQSNFWEIHHQWLLLKGFYRAYAISRTSPGIDDIRYWVYRDCYAELSNVVTKIVKLSIELVRLYPFSYLPGDCGGHQRTRGSGWLNDPATVHKGDHHPSVWHTAVITPVPKFASISSLSHLRPISACPSYLEWFNEWL